MKLPKSESVLKRMRDARLRELRQTGFVIAGSLVKFQGHSSMYLTDKADARTRTLYIPLARLKEVKKWNKNHKKARIALQELSEIQRAILRLEIRKGS